jgi:MFS family permease
VSTIARILAAKGLRGFADGYVSLLLPVYLLSLGLSPFDVGLLATATLLGSGVMTLAVGFHAWRWTHRALLLAACALMAATGLAFASFTQFWPLLMVAVVGTLNPSAGDVSVFLPLEQALLSQSVEDKKRTWVMARYSLVGTLSGALGALAAGVPTLAARFTGVSEPAAIRSMFVGYAVLALLAALAYRGLPRAAPAEAAQPRSALGPSKKRVYALAALFSLDSFGGGLVVQSLVALWLFQRFGLSLSVAGAIFFWAGVLTAASYLVAVRIAERIGLLKTMVFTHIPSSLCLILIPFMPDLGYAIALLLVRSALSQMDVPTRSSYVMAVVQPHERVAAASVTAVPRSLASAVGPVLAGYLLGLTTFGWPLVAGGVIKIVYDLLLLAMFHHVRPPEERDPDS